MANSNCNPLYACKICKNSLAVGEDILSESFLTKSGEAYLFSHAMNVVMGQEEDRQLITGVFTIADIYCSNCGQELGWKYIRAHEETQKYKEGKFVLEKIKMIEEY